MAAWEERMVFLDCSSALIENIAERERRVYI